MAESHVYSGECNHWRAYCTCTTSQSATAVSLSAEAGIQACGWGFAISGGAISCAVTANGKALCSGSGDFSAANGSWDWSKICSGTASFARGTSAYTVPVAVTTTNASGYMDGTATGTGSISVPALDSYKVTYDANGGAGAPAAQVKWYGRALALSTARPTRAGYAFRGWATSKTATTASYQPGASYSADKALALYAVWQLSYRAPTISGLRASRCDSAGAAADDGTYVKVTGSWACGMSGYKASSLKVEARKGGATSWTQLSSSNPGAASGTLSLVTGGGALSADSTWDVRVTVADSGGSASATASVPTRAAAIDVGPGGTSLGLLTVASGTSGRVDVGGGLWVSGTLRRGGVEVATLAQAVVGENGGFASGSTKYWRRVASTTITSATTDRTLRLAVNSGYGALTGASGKWGVLTAHVRSGASLASVDTAELVWEDAGAYVNPADYYLVHKLTSGASLAAEVWARNTVSWQTPHFIALDDSDRTGAYPAPHFWTLYSNTAAAGGSTSIPATASGWTWVRSTVLPRYGSVLGTKVVKGTGANYATLLTAAELKAACRGVAPATACVSVCNGDWNAANVVVTGAVLQGQIVHAFFDRTVASSVSVRVNYHIKYTT